MNILIIRLGSIGDVVLTTPVITALKKIYPDASVDFLVKKEYHELLAGNPHIRKLISFDSTRHKGLKGLFEKTRELRSERYQYVIDLHGNLRSRIISALIHGSKTLRYDKQVVQRRLILNGFKVQTKHTVDAYLSALNTMGMKEVTGFKSVPSLYLSEDEKKEAAAFLKNKGIPEGPIIVGLNPGARWRTKRWTEEGFIDTGRRLVKELGAHIVVFGGPDEVDLCRRIAEGIGKNGLHVAGMVGLKETAALIGRCKVFVSNDSGPMHIATAVGTPVVGIFGPTVCGFGFSPLGKSTVVEKELKCRPCSLHGTNVCPKGHFECMKGIRADDVFEKIMGMLKP